MRRGPVTSMGMHPSVKNSTDGLSDMELYSAFKDMTKKTYHLVKRADESDISHFKYEKWFGETRIWSDKIRFRLLNNKEAERLNYWLEIEDSLKKSFDSMRGRISAGREYSARNLLADLYPHFVGVNDFTESVQVERYDRAGSRSFKETKARLYGKLDASTAKGTFPPIRIGTTNYTYYILDSVQPLSADKTKLGHRDAWYALSTMPDLFAESIDDIVLQLRARKEKYTLGDISYPHVLYRTAVKYVKNRKEGNLSV